MTKVIQVPNLIQNGTQRFVKTQTGAAAMNGKPDKIKGQVLLPDQFTLRGTVTSAQDFTLFNFNDACGLNVAFGVNTGALSSAFALVGGASADNLRALLQSFVPVIDFINYESTVDGVQNQEQLGNTPRIITTNILGNTDGYIVPVKASQRNTQQQRDMQTFYCNGDLAITPFTSIGVATSPPPAPGGGATATKLVDLTFGVSQWIPFNQYFALAKNNPVFDR